VKNNKTATIEIEIIAILWRFSMHHEFEQSTQIVSEVVGWIICLSCPLAEGRKALQYTT
jgi:hypothetical protein